MSEASFYVELIPTFWTRYGSDRPELREVKIGRTWAKKPKTATVGRVVKVTLSAPASMFLIPEVEVSIDLPDVPDPVVSVAIEGPGER